MASGIPPKLKRPPRATSALQLAALKGMFPFSTGSVEKGIVRWGCDGFQGSDSTGLYRIEIEGKPGRKPAVWLSGGSIDEESIEGAPHNYGIDRDRLRVKVCLDRGDWREDQLYARTYVPWAMEWIVHFEIWCATGQWTGGGVHDTPPRDRRA